MSRPFNVGIVGASGLVGETFLKLLGESKYNFTELRLFASPKSKGKLLNFKDQEIPCQVLEEDCFGGLDVVFFSSGDDISEKWAPLAVAQGAIAIDNSAAFRMDPETPLVVPEVNIEAIDDLLRPRVIANPNCSTIQLVMALHALKPLELDSVRVASYQSVSGAGKEGIQDLLDQTKAWLNDGVAESGPVFSPPIAFDCQPKIGSLDKDGFCSEEIKIMNETCKILSMPDLRVSASTVRVPTLNGHGESLWVTFAKEVSKEQVEACFKDADYIQYKDNHQDPCFHTYKEVTDKTDAYVSRLRRDPVFANTWLMWVVADNLYRGAAANGLLIAERIFDKLSES